MYQLSELEISDYFSLSDTGKKAICCNTLIIFVLLLEDCNIDFEAGGIIMWDG